MTSTKKRELWARRVAAWERSGLSRRAWCERHGVNVHTLDYWRYRLRQRAARPVVARSRSKALVPIVVKEAAPLPTAAALGAVPVEIALPSGVQVRVPASTDPRWLASLVRELGAC